MAKYDVTLSKTVYFKSITVEADNKRQARSVFDWDSVPDTLEVDETNTYIAFITEHEEPEEPIFEKVFEESN